MVRLPLKCRYL